MLFIIPFSLLVLYALTDENFRRAYLKGLRLILTIGVIGSLLPIYPALAIALYAYFAYEVYKRRKFHLKFSRVHLVALVFILGLASDYDPITYRIPASYHLISGGGLYYRVGLFEPQNPGMTFISAYFLLLDYYANTPTTLYIYSLRLFNAASLYALLRFLEEFNIDTKRFLIILFTLPVFEMYFSFKSSYSDLTVGLLVVTLFYSIYREPRLIPIIFADLALIKYVRPFIVLAIILLIIPRRLYPIYYAIPLVAIARGDWLGFFYLALLVFALPSLKPIDRRVLWNSLKSYELSILYIWWIRETILFGRIFGVYGTFGTIAHWNLLRPEWLDYVGGILSQVWGILQKYYYFRLNKLLFGSMIIGSLFFYSAAHAPLGSWNSSEIESAAILAGILQIAITYSIVSRQYLYLFIALAIALARLDTFWSVSIPSSFYVYYYFTAPKFTIMPKNTELILALVFFAYFITLLEDRIKLRRHRLILAIIPALLVPVAYYHRALDHYEKNIVDVNENVLEIADYINEHFSPKGTLIMIPGPIPGLATYLKDYTVFNLLDPAEWYGIEGTMEDYKKGIDWLSNYDTIIYILPSQLYRPMYYAFIGEFYYTTLVGITLASNTRYMPFGQFYLLIASNPHQGIAAMAYNLGGSYALIVNNGPTLFGVNLPGLKLGAVAFIVGEKIENATFYFYLELFDGGVYIKQEAKLMRYGVLWLAYLSVAYVSSNYYPVGFSAIIDGKNYTIGEVPP